VLYECLEKAEEEHLDYATDCVFVETCSSSGQL
jgi:hypothetical protein